MIPFNIPLVTGKEIELINECIDNGKFCGDGAYTKLANQTLKEITGAKKVLLTTSCTHALEMSALLLNIKSGDEVIMPSFTFVSTANAFALRGAKIIFVDIHPNSMNIDADQVLSAINPKTKAIVVVHYGGVACDMDRIMTISREYDIPVIEDAAQCIGATYNGSPLGTIGDFGTISFHETKNIHCGEGGALLINNPIYNERAEIIREKGTNRSKFLRGEIDKYSWVDIGSSYLPSELNAAFLLGQLSEIKKVTGRRKELWNTYYDLLYPLAEEGKIKLHDDLRKNTEHNGHLFYIKCAHIEERTQLIQFLKSNDIYCVFHYVPLHSAKEGRQLGTFVGEDIYTTRESNKLLRLPMHVGLEKTEIQIVVEKIYEYYKANI